MMFGKLKSKKGELVWDSLIPWVIALAILILSIILYMTFSDKGQEAVGFLKDFLRFGR